MKSFQEGEWYPLTNPKTGLQQVVRFSNGNFYAESDTPSPGGQQPPAAGNQPVPAWADQISQTPGFRVGDNTDMGAITRVHRRWLVRHEIAQRHDRQDANANSRPRERAATTVANSVAIVRRCTAAVVELRGRQIAIGPTTTTNPSESQRSQEPEENSWYRSFDPCYGRLKRAEYRDRKFFIEGEE